VFSCLELLQTSTVLVIFGDLHPSNSELLCVNAYPLTCDPVRIYYRKCLLLSSMLTMSSFYVCVSPDLWDRFIPDRKCSCSKPWNLNPKPWQGTCVLLSWIIADIDCSCNFWWSSPVEFGIAVCKCLSSNLWPGPDLLPEMPTLVFIVDHVIILCVRVPGSVRSVYSRQEMFLS
jgi:hypothetical protein